ncbi:hypothetical protein [Aeromicrobium sp.]|uniref:hypothetical protein n=1 Tax=Aeromicrobium sp. TaxID=1871063 RepID=UPI0030C429CB
MTDGYRPTARFHDLDVGPDHLQSLMPFDGVAMSWRRGPDDTAYFFFSVPPQVMWLPPDDFDWSRVDARRVRENAAGRRWLDVGVLVVCRRFVGEEIGPGSTKMAVNLAVIIDDRLGDLDTVDFGMVEMIAVCHLTMQPRADPEVERPAGPARAEQPPPKRGLFRRNG